MSTLSIVLSRALFVLLVGGIASGAAAQQTESRIVGRVVDQSGAVLPGVTVTVTSAQTGAVRSVVSDADGAPTRSPTSPAALYEIAFELSGFDVRIRHVSLGVGSVETVDAQLTIAGVSEDVTVRGEIAGAGPELGADRRQRVAGRGRVAAGERPELRQPDDAGHWRHHATATAAGAVSASTASRTSRTT